jgi:hypothetical protein
MRVFLEMEQKYLISLLENNQPAYREERRKF